MKGFVCFLTLVALALAVALPARAADVTGKWSGTFTMTGPDGNTEDSAAFMVLKQNGTELTGTGGPDEGEQWPTEKGKIENNKITGEVHAPDGALYKLDLVLDGDHIKGDVTVTSPDGQTMKAKLDATRAK